MTFFVMLRAKYYCTYSIPFFVHEDLPFFWNLVL